MSLFLLALAAFSGFAYLLGRTRAQSLAQQAGGRRSLASLPLHYGWHIALLFAFPALFVFFLWQVTGPSLLLDSVMETLPHSLLDQSEAELLFLRESIAQLACGKFVPQIPDSRLTSAVELLCDRLETGRLLAGGAALLIGCCSAFWGWKKLSASFSARQALERSGYWLFVTCSGLVVLISLGIILAIFCEAIRFFQAVSVFDFLFGLHWNPQTAIRPDQIASSGSFGAIPVLLGTLLVAVVAMAVAVPVGLFSAMYIGEYASPKWAGILTPLLEVLAAVPTVVYGFFAVFFVAPALHDLGIALGVGVAAESALAAGLVIGVMIVPYLSSLSAEVMQAVPEQLRATSLALGATRYETLRHIVFPAALPGIIASVFLAFSRAIGETMVVLMAGGLVADLTFNPLNSVTTVTVQIVSLLVGEQGFDSSKTLAAFAFGLVLFLCTLIVNLIALHVVRDYRQEYQ